MDNPLHHFMKRPLPIILFFILLCSAVHSQKKSELIAQINELNAVLDSTKNLVSEARRKEAASLAKAESVENRLQDLQSANATLLQNLNSFAEVSKRNTTNAQKAMENLDKKEAQIKTITNVFSTNDSLAVQVVGKAKGVLGDTPQLGIGEKSIAIGYAVTTFFDDYQQSELNESGKTTLALLATFFDAFPQYDIKVEGLSNTGEFDLTGAQANILAFQLSQAGIDINRLSSAGKDGGFKDGFLFRLEPKFDEFYGMVKDQLKNQ